MATANAGPLTLSLNGNNNVSEFLKLPGTRCTIGLELSASNTTAVGTVQFCLTNSSSTAAASLQPMSTPTISVVAGTAVAEFVELKDIAGEYLVLRWVQTTGQAVNVTATVSVKE